jgi:hypothetical protein
MKPATHLFDSIYYFSVMRHITKGSPEKHAIKQLTNHDFSHMHPNLGGEGWAPGRLGQCPKFERIFNFDGF